MNNLKSTTKNDKDLRYKVQVYVEDCIGCGSCVEVCPSKVKSLEMSPINKEIEAGEIENQKFYEELPENILDGTKEVSIKGSQLKQPLFEFSGACAGCGETPYVKLVTQLFGDRMIIANATGCSSIYGGTFPTIPYSKNKEGKGPAWANSLFEDNAEYGFGYRLATDNNRSLLKMYITDLIKKNISADLKTNLNASIELWKATDEKAKTQVKETTKALKIELDKTADAEVKKHVKYCLELEDYLIDKSIWIIGGDGWAFDIGFGGLDHVMASNKNVNILVVDTEVYSNTGGQASKATPRGAVAKFAASGKKLGKKNLGEMMMSYGSAYVASINMGANQTQTVKAIAEAEAFDGPSLIIAYSPCIAHGIDMRTAQAREKLAATSGYWPLYRFNPELKEEGKKPFIWETREPKNDFKEFTKDEIRYKTLYASDPQEAERLHKLALEDNKTRMDNLKKLAE